MWYRILKLSLLALVIFALSGCNKKAHYVYLLQHPDLIQSRLMTCQSEMNAERCINAQIVARVYNEYVSIERAHQQALMDNRDTMMQLQQQGFRAQNDEQQQVLNEFESAQMNIQEQFGQKIIAAQTQLVDLQNQLKQATDSQAKTKIKQQIAYQEKLIEVMYAMIIVNDGWI